MALKLNCIFKTPGGILSLLQRYESLSQVWWDITIILAPKCLMRKDWHKFEANVGLPCEFWASLIYCVRLYLKKKWGGGVEMHLNTGPSGSWDKSALVIIRRCVCTQYREMEKNTHERWVPAACCPFASITGDKGHGYNVIVSSWVHSIYEDLLPRIFNSEFSIWWKINQPLPLK